MFTPSNKQHSQETVQMALHMLANISCIPIKETTSLKDSQEVAETLDSLTIAQSICSKQENVGLKMVDSAFSETLRPCIQKPIVAAGVLHWIRYLLLDKRFRSHRFVGSTV